MLIYILCVVLAYGFMEFVAWFMHKFVMHGFLWTLHEDHHVRKPGFIEKNDSFFLIFATPGILAILTGVLTTYTFFLFIGLGITLYGLTYFLVHDLLIHQRLKFFKNSNIAYIRAIRKAHRKHHSHLTKEDGECFGLLVIPKKYLKEAKQEIAAKKLNKA